MAAYYMWKECPAGTTAFNPANRITFAGGPMTGLKQTGAAKWTAGAISPSINLNADTAATASWGIEMKETGYRCHRGVWSIAEAGLHRGG